MSLSRTAAGLFAAAAAFFGWGVLPVYWKALKQVPAEELICHRIVWCMVFSALVLTLQKRWGAVRELATQGRSLLLLCCSAVLVFANWFIYVWAVNADHVVDASLGYYINPLVNVLLGWLAFRDGLNRAQSVAIALAGAGVCVSLVHFGKLPWIALSLAFSFGTYGLVRKVVRTEPLPGLFFETLLLTAPCAAFLVWREVQGVGALGRLAPGETLLLLGSGAITALPLLSFSFAVRRLRLVTVGVMQYIAPTCMFLLGVFAYGEPFGFAQGVTFACIWAGVAVYVSDGLRSYRRERALLRAGRS